MRLSIRLIVRTLAGAFILAWYSRAFWQPWVSPAQCAYVLANSTPKNFSFTLREASMHWGSKLYMPLSIETNGFTKMHWCPLLCVFEELLRQDSAQNVLNVTSQLLSSRAVNARLLGCISSAVHELSLNAEKACAVLAEKALVEPTGVDGRYFSTRLALNYLAISDLPESASLIRVQLDSLQGQARVDACRVAEEIHTQDRSVVDRCKEIELAEKRRNAW